MRDRGQVFTLEAIVASLLLLGSVAFVLQVPGVTPHTTSSAGPQADRSLDGVATGTLDSAEANGSLLPLLLYWNASGGRFHGASESYYVARMPPTRFGAVLDRKFDDRSTAINVNVYYLTADGDRAKQRLIHYGTPTDDAVRSSVPVTLYDDSVLYNASGTPSNVRIGETDRFYAPDAAPGSPVYNTLRVEVIVWQA